ncbi:hypothetical protein SMACR_08798 [Sordaria macrospora]|uniref:Uncharacterized protein n=1 Tax=Sordaria macrospora TaxID=5147 RepID=A0A8S8ZJY6_SORMA|nr:hypothetical protein SMACR_08798 [Sordaria macrospora]WPJ64521.1 hypothetical protein SMAC4_08798 [Sordaria macrospora]
MSKRIVRQLERLRHIFYSFGTMKTAFRCSLFESSLLSAVTPPSPILRMETSSTGTASPTLLLPTLSRTSWRE